MTKVRRLKDRNDRKPLYKFLPLTKYQGIILDDIVNKKGLGEGVVRLYKRLQYDLQDKLHYATVSGKPDKDVALVDDMALEEKENWKNLVSNYTNLGERGYSYSHGGKVYKSVYHEYTLERPTKVPGKFHTEHAIKLRKLLPSRNAIEDYISKNPRHQRDRPTRNNVAGGIRTPLKTAIKAVLTKKPFDIVFCDSMRMPACEHYDDDVVKLSAEDILSAGAKKPIRKKTTYRWLFLCVDAHSKLVWVKEIFQKDSLSAGDLSGGYIGQYDDNAGSPSSRPQSDATFKAFTEFVNLVNNVRLQHHVRKKGNKRGFREILPKLVVHDNGSEFKREWIQGMEKLKKKHAGYFSETVTPHGRSQYNSMAERHIKTIRRYFYSIHNSFVEQVFKRDGQNPDNVKARPLKNWHTAEQKGTAAVSKSDVYDWVLDIPEVLKRYNTGYHTTIKARPIDVLLERTNESAHDKIEKRIYDNAYDPNRGRYRDVILEKRLPGFTPSIPPKVGDFCRIKSYKSGDNNLKWENSFDATRKLSNKSASDNFSKEIYIIVEIKKIIDPRGKKFGSTDTYKLKHVSRKRKVHPRGFLDRTQILKIPKDTKIYFSDLNKEMKVQDYYKTPVSVPKLVVEKEKKPKKVKKTKPLSEWKSKEWRALLNDKQFKDEGGRWIIVDVKYDPSEKLYWAVYTKIGAKNIKKNREFTPILELLEDKKVVWSGGLDVKKYARAIK